MINKKSKTAYQIILGGIMLVSVATVGCNDTTTTENNADTTATKMEEVAPVVAPVVDTMAKVIDTVTTRPIVPTNKTTTPPPTNP